MQRCTNVSPVAVAPHAGAWIEMADMTSSMRRACVAPHAGAWIEIGTASTTCAFSRVAPHAGAWIEMTTPLKDVSDAVSRPTRARGLKCRQLREHQRASRRAPRGRVD